MAKDTQISRVGLLGGRLIHSMIIFFLKKTSILHVHVYENSYLSFDRRCR